MDMIEDAVKDFEKSVSLSPMFAVAHVQKCYTGGVYLFPYLFVLMYYIPDETLI